MRFLLIVLILFTFTACAPLQEIPQATRIPNPISITSGPPIPSVSTPDTIIPACDCPTGLGTPSQSQGEGNGLPSVICNCPALIIPPPTAGTEGAANSQPTPTNGITMADNGGTIKLHPGGRVLLDLGMNGFDWAIAIDNQDVLSLVKGIMVPLGAQGLFEAKKTGQSLLTATGNPLCRNSIPACGAPSIFFRITVIVQ
jgi:hypothetical protein